MFQYLGARIGKLNTKQTKCDAKNGVKDGRDNANFTLLGGGADQCLMQKRPLHLKADSL